MRQNRHLAIAISGLFSLGLIAAAPLQAQTATPPAQAQKGMEKKTEKKVEKKTEQKKADTAKGKSDDKGRTHGMEQGQKKGMDQGQKKGLDKTPAGQGKKS